MPNTPARLRIDRPTGKLTAFLVAAVATLVSAAPASAQLTLSGNSYFENFNAIDTGLPTGWTVRTGATTGSLGTPAAFNATRTAWGAPAGAFNNYASANNEPGTPFTGAEPPATQNAAADRAPGVRQNAAFGDPGAAFVLQIANTVNLINFDLTLDFEMLAVNARSTTWVVEFAIGANPTTFTQVGPTFTDPGAFGTTPLTFDFGGALDNQTENVWIRVVALNPSTGSGLRDTFGIDNFNLTWTVVPEPSSVLLACAAAAGAVCVVRRRLRRLPPAPAAVQ